MRFVKKPARLVHLNTVCKSSCGEEISNDANLEGLKVAILVAEGFEQVELTEPKKALESSGAQTQIVSPVKDRVQGWNHFEKGDRFPVEVPLGEAEARDFDALLLPGGIAKSRSVTDPTESNRICSRVFCRQQTCCLDLSWSMAADRSGGGARPHGDLLAIVENGLDQCRRQVGRSGGGHR
jgi:hypothetical protein